LEGKLLQVINDGVMEPGTHQINFNRDLKTGTFLLVAKSKNYQTVRRVLLVK
jgi:hypothetical protein